MVIKFHSKLHRVRFSDDLDERLIRDWLTDNCKSLYYFGRDWNHWDIGGKNRMIKFENEAEAALFTLTWC